MSVNDISTLSNSINERRHSRSQTGKEDLLYNFRRFSKSNNSGSESSLITPTKTNFVTTTEFGISLAEQLKLTRFLLIICFFLI